MYEYNNTKLILYFQGLIGISLPLPSIYRTLQSIYRLENADKKLITITYVDSTGKIVEKQQQLEQ